MRRVFQRTVRETEMDPINLLYYAAICAALSAVSPRFKTMPLRLMIGAVVGLIAAAVLPFAKTLF